MRLDTALLAGRLADCGARRQRTLEVAAESGLRHGCDPARPVARRPARWLPPRRFRRLYL
eukprot:scaffold15200_cov111-Isochrysis_galbana.AAC.3